MAKQKGPTLEWVKAELQEYIMAHKQVPEDAALVLNALKDLGGLLVKELPPPKVAANGPPIPAKALEGVAKERE